VRKAYMEVEADERNICSKGRKEMSLETQA
jgi:hypothetical protein